jgi:RNA-directed DNA polymerase
VVARLSFEPLVEPEFLNDSYGDRPKKSAIDAVRVTRKTLLVSRLGSGI